MKTKVCLHCEQRRSVDLFSKDRKRKDGRYVYCRLCTKAARTGKSLNSGLPLGRKFSYSPDAKKKICPECGKKKLLKYFNLSKRGPLGRTSYCIGCIEERGRRRRLEFHDKVTQERARWVRKNPDRWSAIKEQQRKNKIEKRRVIRAEVLHAYGDQCACCGVDEPEFLTIDHKHGGGRRERATRKWSSSSLYAYLKDSGFPKHAYRLLCANCNSALGYYGYCPHKSQKRVRRARASVATARERLRRREARLRVIAAYGNSCVCCGEFNWEFLAIDHVDGSGKDHRREIGINKITFWLIDNNFPKGRFRLLCHNCHGAITRTRRCVGHQKKMVSACS